MPTGLLDVGEDIGTGAEREVGSRRLPFFPLFLPPSLATSMLSVSLYGYSSLPSFLPPSRVFSMPSPFSFTLDEDNLKKLLF